MKSVMLACGCRAHGTHGNAHDGLPENHPSCVVHFEKGDLRACTVVESPNLEGRLAKCLCGRSKPSSLDLAFFEYVGPGSPESTNRCKCGYFKCAHTKEGMAGNVKHNRKTVIERGECRGFEAHGPFEFDRYYCGCRGWD